MQFLSMLCRVQAGILWVVLLLPSPSRATHFTDSTALVAESLYHSLAFTEKPDIDLLRRALAGYHELKRQHRLSNKQIITIVDFRKASNERRLWVIDLAKRRIRYHTLVAHGRNSGELFATRFSNRINSHQSSLGFYVTGDIYYGKHGLSLKLQGVERGINDQAEARAIVMHGADYVSESFIKKIGRLGRSLGCPAIPYDVHKELIRDLAGRTCLFIYYPDESYLRMSSIGNTSLPVASR
jgi:hypothetical protein